MYRFCGQASPSYLKEQKRERARLLTSRRGCRAGPVRSGPTGLSRRGHLRPTPGSPVAPMWDPCTTLLSWPSLGPRLRRSELEGLEECKRSSHADNP